MSLPLLKGFWSDSDLRRSKPLPVKAECFKCGLDKSCLQKRPMPVYGKGKLGVLVVGESPGEEEDREGRPFIGPAGRLLRDHLGAIDVDLDNDCWTINSVRCRPPRNNTKEKHVNFCRPNVIDDIKSLSPKTIILLGTHAVRSVIGWLWKGDDIGGALRWAGWRVPVTEPNLWLCPTYHPSYVLRERKDDFKNVPLENAFSRHLRDAFDQEDRPWKEKPDYTRGLQVELDPHRASLLIDNVLHTGKPFAWDLETDRLFPDHPDSEIICCSVSNGQASVAALWHGEAREAFCRILASELPKIVWNVKFEAGWAGRHGVKVNWKGGRDFDGMLLSQMLDNRKKQRTKNLEFQAFVRLGANAYKDFAPEMKAPGSNARNNLHRVPKHKILKYCALDSYLEWKVTKVLTKELGIKL